MVLLWSVCAETLQVCDATASYGQVTWLYVVLYVWASSVRCAGVTLASTASRDCSNSGKLDRNQSVWLVVRESGNLEGSLRTTLAYEVHAFAAHSGIGNTKILRKRWWTSRRQVKHRPPPVRHPRRAAKCRALPLLFHEVHRALLRFRRSRFLLQMLG